MDSDVIWKFNPDKANRIVGGVLSLLIAAITPVASQTPSEPLRDFFAPIVSDTGEVVSTIGRIEITLLSKPRFLGTTIVQMTKIGAARPDAFAINVLHPSYPGDSASGLFCYISPGSGDAFRQAFIGGELVTAKEPFSDAAKALMEDFAKEVEAATRGMAADKIGLGVALKFPEFSI